MADLSIYLSTAVNGVAKIHTEILKHHVFRDWYAVFPEKFQNKTNGITPRRWLGLSNPELTRLLEEYVSPGFLTQLDWLQVLKPVIDDELISKFNQVKFTKKQQLGEKCSGIRRGVVGGSPLRLRRAHQAPARI